MTLIRLALKSVMEKLLELLRLIRFHDLRFLQLPIVFLPLAPQFAHELNELWILPDIL
jgi:hypothetical protein